MFFPTIEGAKITNRIPWWDLIPGDVDCVSNWSNSPLGFSRVKRTPRERGHIFWHVHDSAVCSLRLFCGCFCKPWKKEREQKVRVVFQWLFTGVFIFTPLSMGEYCQFWLMFFFSEVGSKHHLENDAKLCRYNELTRKCIHDIFIYFWYIQSLKGATWKSTWMLTCICYLNM